MIYSEIRGRCGNQMFLYAVSRQLEQMYGEGITFNFYQIEQEAKKDTTWKDDLKLFKVKPYLTESYRKQLVFLHGNIIQKTLLKIYELICRLPYKTRPDFQKDLLLLFFEGITGNRRIVFQFQRL